MRRKEVWDQVGSKGSIGGRFLDFCSSTAERGMGEEASLPIQGSLLID